MGGGGGGGGCVAFFPDLGFVCLGGGGRGDGAHLKGLTLTNFCVVIATIPWAIRGRWPRNLRGWLGACGVASSGV